MTERAAVCIALVQPQLVRGQFASPRTHEPSHCTPLGMPPQSVVRCAAAACGSSRRAVDAGTRVPPERNPLRNQHRRRPDRARVGHHPTQAGHAHLSAHSSAKAAAATPLPLRGHPQQPPSPLPPSRPQPTATLPTLQALHPPPIWGEVLPRPTYPRPPTARGRARSGSRRQPVASIKGFCAGEGHRHTEGWAPRSTRAARHERFMCPHPNGR